MGVDGGGGGAVAGGEEEAVVLLLSGLKSSYCYALHREVREEEVWGAAEDAGDGHPPAGAVADGVAVRAVMRVHVVEWSRRPSPHEPLPDVRVRMEVALLHPPSPSTPPLYRLEGELCVHPFVAGDASVGGRLQSVDGALLRALKMKAEMYRTPRTATPLSQQQTAFQRTRLAYHTFTPPPPRPSFAQPPLLPASQLLASLTQHLTTISSFTPSSCPPSIQCSGREAGGGAAQSKAKWSWSEDEDFDGEERGAGRAEEQPRENAVPSTPLKVLDGARGRPGAANDGAAAATAASAALNLAAATAASSATSITATTRDSTSSLSSASPLPAVSASASSSAASSASGSLSVSPYSVVPSAAALEGRLVDLFRGADADGSGRLSVSEVTALLSGGELGLSLSSSSLHAMVVGVMSTYDTNDDGQLVWAEFLPVAVDLLQTASAAKLAKAEMQRQREEGAAALERRLGGRSAADWAAEVAICVGALDPSHTHLLPPAAFQQLAHQLPCHLSAGDVVYGPFAEHSLTFLADVMQAATWSAGSSQMERDLLLLCSPLESPTPSPTHPPTTQPTQKRSSNRYSPERGYLSVAAATSLLKAASSIGIHLSPTQLSAMVSADVPSSGLFELSSFVRQSSLMLAFLFDRQSVVERSALSERGVVAPIALLTAEDRERVEAELRQRFAEFDSNNDGTLDADEFAACLSDTSLCLSAQQIESLRKEVVQAAAAEGSADSGGAIEIHHFMTFAYAKLLHLAREARIQQNYVNLTSLR